MHRSQATLPHDASVPACLRLEIDLQAPDGNRPDSASPPTGTHFRGSLGKALVDSFCAFGEPRCDPKGMDLPSPPRDPKELCRLAAACPYGVLFAASLTRRPPFALSLPEGQEAGGRLSVELTLYGPAWRHYAWLLVALPRAVQRLGSRDDLRFRIAGLRRIHPDRSALPADLDPDLLGLSPDPFVAPRPVVIDLLSPTHLLVQRRPLPLDEPVPFQVLVESTLDRFAGLYGSAASAVLLFSIRSTVEAEAARVPLLEQDLRPADAGHYSRRSRSRFDLGGVVGRLVYGPTAAGFLHILHAAEILHLGKNPTFGCGRLQVTVTA